MSKVIKTKDELRAMILAEIEAHPVCPEGMDVRVRADEQHRWAVDSIPPAGSHIAYADCANYIGRVAQRLRAEYDLAPSN